MAKKTIFVRSQGDDVVRLIDLLPSLSTKVQSELKSAGEQLATQGQIKNMRASVLQNDDWSVWIENEDGERENFLLYISALEADKVRTVTQKVARRLGVYIQHGQAQGSWEEFVEASIYITSNYTGEICDNLLKALNLVSQLKSAFDGSIGYTHDGVILRALSRKSQIRLFDAEVRLTWER